ncbi:MAG: Fic family protein, partial [Bacteroidetes bacterium]|nr:Fic family protein [Bacteroidota bacterium]
LYTNPVVDAAKVGKIIGKQPQSVYQLIDKMEEAGILKEITGADRGRLFILDEYLKLFEN